VSSPCVFDLKKKNSPNTFWPYCAHVETKCGAHPLYTKRVKRALFVLIW
jgi:hypothetical protein